MAQAITSPPSNKSHHAFHIIFWDVISIFVIVAHYIHLMITIPCFYWDQDKDLRHFSLVLSITCVGGGKLEQDKAIHTENK